jgi:uncharacterized protein YdaU (DUF1376 family)
MPFYVGDYIADTMHLSKAEHGAYLLLIFAYWKNHGPLADDDKILAAITKSTIKEWRKLRLVVAKFFIIGDHFWRHKRIDIELDRAGLSQTRSEAGKKGAAARWQTNGKPDGKPDGKRMARARGKTPQPQPQYPPLLSPTGTFSPPKRCGKKIGPLTTQMEGFALAADNDTRNRGTDRSAAKPLLDRGGTAGGTACDC